MCNRDHLRLVAGDPVRVTGVDYNHVIFDVEVVQDRFGILHVEATKPGGNPRKIPHCYLFASVCPPGLDSKQQNLWRVLRHCFRQEIAYYQQVTPAPVVETKLAPGVLLLDPDMVVERLSPEGMARRPDTSVLTSRHLRLESLAEGLFQLPTPDGPLWISRTISLGRDAYQLRLERVPPGHCLYQLFVGEEKRVGRKICVWIDRTGFLLATVDSPAWHLAEYLHETLAREVGQKKVV